MTTPRGRPEQVTRPAEKRGRVLLRDATKDPADVPSATEGDNTIVSAIQDAVGRQRNIFTWWSNTQETVTLTTCAGVVALPNVVVTDLPDDAIVTHATVWFAYGEIEDTSNALNDLNAACGVDIQIKEAASSFIAAINLVDQQFQVKARGRRGSDAVPGDVDVGSEIENNINSTYNFQFASVTATGDNLIFRDVQIGLQIMWQ